MLFQANMFQTKLLDSFSLPFLSVLYGEFTWDQAKIYIVQNLYFTYEKKVKSILEFS